MLSDTFNAEIVNYNNDYRYDTLMKLDTGKTIKVEIKEDFTCKRTGNVGVEYSCRGKDSGITTTEAQLYFYKVHTPKGIKNILMTTKNLKRIISEEKYFRTVNGGDPGSNSLNYLFKLGVFLENGIVIEK